MTAKQGKHKLFGGMNYRDLQRSNSTRRGRLPVKDQTWLKQNGYKNVGWAQVINLHQKINDLLMPPDPDEATLEELFLQADRIGNKYQTPEEIADFNHQLRTEAQEISAEVDRQFPEEGVEFIDYGKQRRSPQKKKRR